MDQYVFAARDQQPVVAERRHGYLVAEWDWWHESDTAQGWDWFDLARIDGPRTGYVPVFAVPGQHVTAYAKHPWEPDDLQVFPPARGHATEEDRRRRLGILRTTGIDG